MTKTKTMTKNKIQNQSFKSKNVMLGKRHEMPIDAVLTSHWLIGKAGLVVELH
jgi:hypothetical protein